MNAARQACRPKHQVLVLKCYPKFQKNNTDVKANSSELSYLLYYASTRRSKLQKVGDFLDKRTTADVWKNRVGYVYLCNCYALPRCTRKVYAVANTLAQQCQSHPRDPQGAHREMPARPPPLRRLSAVHSPQHPQISRRGYGRRIGAYLCHTMQASGSCQSLRRPRLHQAVRGDCAAIRGICVERGGQGYENTH
jgi:hypothetical protein